MQGLSTSLQEASLWVWVGKTAIRSSLQTLSASSSLHTAVIVRKWLHMGVPTHQAWISCVKHFYNITLLTNLDSECPLPTTTCCTLLFCLRGGLSLVNFLYLLLCLQVTGWSVSVKTKNDTITGAARMWTISRGCSHQIEVFIRGAEGWEGLGQDKKTSATCLKLHASFNDREKMKSI